MGMLAITIPILPGKEAEWKAGMELLKTKFKSQFEASRKKLGVRERTFHQVTPMGEFITITLEGNDVGNAFANFFTANDEFTNWMKGWAQSVHGMNLDGPMPPLPELVADSGAN